MDASTAAESCISNPSATFVPGSSSTTSGSVRPTGTGSGVGTNGGSVSLIDSVQSLALAMGISAAGALWTLFA